MGKICNSTLMVQSGLLLFQLRVAHMPALASPLVRKGVLLQPLTWILLQFAIRSPGCLQRHRRTTLPLRREFRKISDIWSSRKLPMDQTNSVRALNVCIVPKSTPAVGVVLQYLLVVGICEDLYIPAPPHLAQAALLLQVSGCPSGRTQG
jgi:hypothetical protein